MKLLLLFFVFAAFCYTGYYLWKGYHTRKKFFADLLAFCEHLLIEISFSKNTVRNIINTYGSGYGRHFRDVLMNYQKLLDEKSDIKREKIETIFSNKRSFIVPFKLKPNEMSEIAEFFYELGRHGSAQEREKIENKKITFDTFFNSAVAAMKRDASIYLKLFILIGAGAVILLL